MKRTTTRVLLVAAVALSLLAALFHLWVMPGHFAEWWGYGAFFLVAAAAQALFALLVLRAPQPWLLRAGIVGNLAIIALWVVTRTVGVPVFGPHAGEVEAVGRLDVASKLAEAALVAVLAILLFGAHDLRAVGMWGTPLRTPRNGTLGHR